MSKHCYNHTMKYKTAAKIAELQSHAAIRMIHKNTISMKKQVLKNYIQHDTLYINLKTS